MRRFLARLASRTLASIGLLPRVSCGKILPFDNARELLFLRFPYSDLEPDGVVSLANIKFPDISCYRNSLSRAFHALHPRCCEGNKRFLRGVLAVPVGDVPKNLNGAALGTYEIRVAHEPVPLCYAHSEIHVQQNDVPQKPPRPLRMQFRLELRAKSKVVVVPRESSAMWWIQLLGSVE